MKPFNFFSEPYLKSNFPLPNVGVKSSEDASNDALERYCHYFKISRPALEEALQIKQAAPKAPKLRVEIPPLPYEATIRRLDAGEVWECLIEWARDNGVDTDQALLIIACVAAHAAGPGLEFEGIGRRKYPAPTLIATTQNSGFQQAVSGALRPLRQIQQDLIERYHVAVTRKTKLSAEEYRELRRRQNIREYEAFHGPGYARLNPDHQADGVVRFILEGKPPSDPHRALEACHLHTALALLQVERLPLTTRPRERQLEAIESMVTGFRRGSVWIRGFVRLFPDYFEWVLSSTRYLRTKTLPVGGAEESVPVAPLRDQRGKLEFDRIHAADMREVLHLRFERADPSVNFRDGEAASHFGLLREAYRQEMCAVSHLAPLCEILPDLFVWYLLRLLKSPHVRADEMEIGARAIEAARTIRRKVAGIYDRHDGLVIARKRLALARKLVKRLHKLGGSCTRRDLVRVLDMQRKVALTTILDLLMRHQVIGGKGKGVTMRRRERLDEIGLEAFMPLLEDVLYSGTKRLRITEQHQADLAASQSSAQEPNHS